MPDSGRFDAAFYLATNPDVAAAGIDPLTHWQTTGWREGRDPNSGFDTRFYVAGLTEPLAGLDPLEHFAAIGRADGRHPAPPHTPELAAMFGALRRVAVPPAPAVASLAARALAAMLAERLVGRRYLCLSIGHDAFAASVGGVQLITAAEQLRVGGSHGVHLHLSPAEPVVRLLLDAVDIGTATVASVRRATSAVPDVRLVVHSLIGHDPELLARLARPAEFWLHDYATLCASPQLLRNDHAFCHAPAPVSGACTICVHGEGRAALLRRSLAATERARLVAPSDTARAVWSAGAGIDPSRVEVRPHLTLAPASHPALARPSVPPTAAARIAFAGTPAFHKGYGHALDLMRHHSGLTWFATGSLDGATSLSASTGARDPWALSRALAGAAVDLVLVLSPWPETFCLVAHEAIAAGCDVLTLAASGHAAAVVATTGRGVVFDDVAAASRWLADDAAGYLAGRRARPPDPLTLAWSGDITSDPEPLLLDGPRVLRPESVGTAWSWTLPPGHAGALRLRSRWFVPNWRRPEPYDDRRLGLDVTSIMFDGRPIDLGATQGGGWHAAEAFGRWTDGDAALDVGGAARVVLHTGGAGRYPA